MKRLPWLFIATSLIAASARGAPLTAAIRVERAAEARDCPDGPTLTASVERILQRSLAPGTRAEETLEVLVRFGGGHDDYSAEVRSLGAKPGVRSLRDRGAHCAALAEAVSVAIALLLDKELERREAEAARAPEPKPALEPASKPVAPQVLPGEQRVLQNLRAGFEAGAATGLLGSTTALLSGHLGVRLRPGLILDAGFNAALPTETHYGAGVVREALLFGSLRACYAWGGRFWVGPCAELGLGQLRGSGLGYATASTKSLLWSAVGAGVVAEGPVWGRVFWGLSANAWLPTRRSSFSVENRGTAWEASPVGGVFAGRLGLLL